MDGSQKNCPYCDEPIRVNAVKCKHCGSMLSNVTSVGGSLTGIDLVKNALGNRYEIIGEIGRGGMATVYKAVQKNLDRPVALKVVHQNLLHDEESVARFHREAQLCASLNHPNIVTIYDAGQVSGVNFIAMEYLEGCTLHEVIKNNNRLSLKQTCDYLLPVAMALDHAHARGIIHRDVKSTNIFIPRDNSSVLLDFGIARAHESTKLTETGLLFGTPGYLSPEQVDGKTVDHRTDVYSLGVVLYECITGCTPFKADSIHVTLYKIINEEPVKPSTINPEVSQYLESLILNSMKKHPNDRYCTTMDIVYDLFWELDKAEECQHYERPGPGEMTGRNLIKNALAGRYEILKLINPELLKEFRFPIYKAIDKKYNRPVAIKLRDQYMVKIPEFYNIICNEASIWRDLDHPNIIKVYEEDNLGGVYFLAMEYIPGKTLKRIIQENGPLDMQYTLKILLPLIKATEYLQSHGTFHRYIVSENILITDKDQSILLDFGISHALKYYTEVLYETLSSKFFHCFAPTDMVGLGIILFECLTGQVSKPESLDAFTPIAEIEFFMNNSTKSKYVPSCMKEIVLKSISQNENNRYLKFSDMIHDLEQCMGQSK